MRVFKVTLPMAGFGLDKMILWNAMQYKCCRFEVLYRQNAGSIAL